MKLLTGLRALACIAALSVAAMAAPALAATTDDFPAVAPICDVTDDLAVLGMTDAGLDCRVFQAVELLDVDVAVAALLSPSGAARADCANGPAWVAVELADGRLVADRLPACSRHYDPGWRS